MNHTCSWEIKGFNKSLFYGIKLPLLLTSSVDGTRMNPPSCRIINRVYFFLGPCLLVCQFLEIFKKFSYKVCRGENTYKFRDVQIFKVCSIVVFVYPESTNDLTEAKIIQSFLYLFIFCF